MIDRDLDRILADDLEIAAVLMTRGGWVSSPGLLRLSQRFPADEHSPALWMIELLPGAGDDAPWHVVYTKADAIVGVSCRRPSNDHQE